MYQETEILGKFNKILNFKFQNLKGLIILIESEEVK